MLVTYVAIFTQNTQIIVDSNPKGEVIKVTNEISTPNDEGSYVHNYLSSFKFCLLPGDQTNKLLTQMVDQ